MSKTFMIDQVTVKEKIDGFKIKEKWLPFKIIVAIVLCGILCGMVLG